ncbi:LysR family transcriptional regulator [Edwardsiella ictaluri]|uniref:Transcriptional regulator, LysR family n=1 Tax=Edwardsiella ictaluri (strain 93-146) TaxID=634503 RepID=C5BEG7_EDWI9|nr:LysR family transcriptional regulator [Edwardsiella ictaluri]ACR69967.1 transcriptional regulator, LysR family [Edwardsiella ictaluri 93-146]AVZ83112.1 LysR family transcriptional regulator [Edwardsiella ictaluri]EKS7763838.1 LysR family transcriptional regulator [Edwardsiella ictaluri]EKS7770620.1 LysR family transcriptional regulator [Edwardsiella ictaluri]EKS7773761.1 LysR family transcriptional regulator [Edwardsiella ictaluri]
MRINLEVLLILDALDRHGSFAAAAQSLYKTPAALSYMVQKLESNLNLQLLDRSGHRARFTRSGRIILEKGRRLLSEAQELELQATLLESGWEMEIFIALEGYILPHTLDPVIGAFIQAHPHTRLHLMPHTPTHNGQSGEPGVMADIIIGTAPLLPENSDYTYQSLGYIDTLLAMTPDHPLSRSGHPLTPDQLGEQRTIVMGDRLAVSPATVGQETPQHIVVYDPAYQISLLLSGAGIGYLPRHAIRPYLTQRRLSAPPLTFTPAHEAAYVGWRHTKAGHAAQWWREHLLNGDLHPALFGD